MSAPSKRQQVINYVKNQSLVRSKEIEDQGLPRAYLYQLARDGIIENIGRGIYQWPDIELDAHTALAEVAKKIPKGVVSLLSALSFHELTSQNPFEVWIALEAKSWKPNIDYPATRIVFMSGESIKAGIDVHSISGIEVKVFNPAKTVADCFKYRNKIGLDIALEALKEGWKMKRFTINELMHYAEICRVKNVIQPYMEVLV